VWPSTWAGSGHLHSFTISKHASWCQTSINILALLDPFNERVSILKIELLDAGFLYNAPRFDQTRTITGECAIEIVLRKHGRS
jgi:hypothetical protein